MDGVNLSSAQRQKLAIARALLKGSQILIFDEATSSIDNVSQSEIQKSINNLVNEKTVIVISHRLSATSMCDKIFVIDKGVVVAEGNHKNASDFEFLEDYGILSSEKISDYLMENFADEIDGEFGLEKLMVNHVYNNNDLYMLFKDFMSGIRSNRNEKIIGCVTSHEGIYEDEWIDERTLLYTGEGKKGDQTPTSSGNKDLIIAANNKEWKVFLFEKIKPNRYYFRGEVEVEPTIRQKNNVLGEDFKPRSVIQFVLRLKEDNEGLVYTEEDSLVIEQNKKRAIEKLMPDVIHQIAKNKDDERKCA